MKRHLRFDHLSHAPHHVSHLNHIEAIDSGVSFLTYLKDAIPLDVISVFITNYNREPDASVLYVLRLERDKLELYESSANTENNIGYHFQDDSITLNSKPMSSIYKAAFKKRLSDIIQDLKLNKCEILEETL